MSENPACHYLPLARLHWEQGVPSSAEYRDVYHSREDGLAETRHVFLQHNDLARRWRGLDPDHPGVFTLAETGFGTGLNCLAACQLWRRSAPPGWRLQLISVERHPLGREDLQRALNQWPELAAWSAALLSDYPPPLPGQHRLWLADDISLDLLLGDALERLPELLDTLHPDWSARCGVGVDAWFLDGFAPGNNPGMWREELFSAIAALSHPGTTFATFTAAGAVRRGLESRGFVVERVTGYGRKREMLRGTHTGTPAGLAPGKQEAVPWQLRSASENARQVTVIGAGLAGSSTAAALARRGLEVVVLEAGPAPAPGASGNPQGIVYTRLPSELDAAGQFHLHAFLHALRHYRGLWSTDPDAGDACGMLQLFQGPDQIRQWNKLRQRYDGHPWVEFVDATRASELAGLPLTQRAIHFPQAGWLAPESVCRKALSGTGIELRCNAAAATIERDQQCWRILAEDGQLLSESDAVVIANSHQASGFDQCGWLPLRAIRGQLSYLPAAALPRHPATIICHEGYLAPPVGGTFCIGATYDTRCLDTELRDSDHRANLEQLEQALPGLASGVQPIGGRAGLRCGSPDHLPLVGQLPVAEDFRRDYAALSRDARQRIDRPGSYHPGLYLNLAHGSRGLASTPISAELIASLIANETRPLPWELRRALSPARFLIRDLKRGKGVK